MDYWGGGGGGAKGMLVPLSNYLGGGLGPLAPLFLRLCNKDNNNKKKKRNVTQCGMLGMMQLPRCSSLRQSVCKPRRLKTSFHIFFSLWT